MDYGLLNPRAFIPQLRRYPWYPFEDLSFELEELDIILSFATNRFSLFRQTMPCRNKAIEYFEISSPTDDDTLIVKEWFSHGENIIWSPSGITVINSFSDYVVLAMPDKLFLDVFGQSGREMFDESVSAFKDGNGHLSLLAFMAAVKETWN